MAAKKPKLTVVGPAGFLGETPAAPAHLGDAGRLLWQEIQAQYQIADAGGRALLQQAAEAADRVNECREIVAAQGAVVRVKGGAPRAHPLLSVERDARAAMLRAVRFLNLDTEPLQAVGRPPGAKGG